MRPAKLTAEDRELVWAAHMLGWTVERMAEYFGVSRQTIQRAIDDAERTRERISRRRLESVA
jgi:DNA-directed RNA polymerase specialized sigma24 family protein